MGRLYRAAVMTAALCVALGCSAKDQSPPAAEQAAGKASKKAAPGDACIAEAPMPPVELPWKDVAAFCDGAPRGEEWADAVPGAGEGEPLSDVYAERVAGWLRSLAYRSTPYDWLHDARWRLTGDYAGCPPDGTDHGPHPAVRIYYSPEVVDWLCTARRGADQIADADDLPAGAMIIKEMISPASVTLKRKPGSDTLWIAPPEGDQKPYDDAFDSWTVMIKAPGHSADGWYYAYFARAPGGGNPALRDRAGFSAATYPGSDGQPVTTPPGHDWYPTYWKYGVADVQFPNYGFGNYCTYCHASAQGEHTFSSISNILGTEIEYDWRPKPAPTDHDDHAKGQGVDPKAAEHRGPFPVPRDSPPAGFAAAFTDLGTEYAAVWDGRLPSQTWDHTVSKVGVEGAPPEGSTFLTSDQCQACHAAGGAGQLERPYMVVDDGDAQIDVSPWAEWSVSPMGLAGRDPIFHAQLELERNIASGQPGLADIKDCIDNTCLHCHGASGARQYNIDTAGQGPADDPCAAFLPQPPDRRATDYDGKLFTQEMVFAWRDEGGENAKYGGLARDGINCTICHRMAATDLDPENLPRTFTGNYRVGPPDVIYGPFPNDDSKEDVITAPMENTLAITPEYGAQIADSTMCGTCHTVFLPVFDDQGQPAGTAYEQTTYLEWLLSDFAVQGEGFQSCQDCHMQSRYGDRHPLKTGIANVQDTRYPEADYLLPGDQIDNPKRPYNRHQLYGLNAFLNAFAQQYPLILGIRQQNYMNGNVVAPLITGRETVLEVARKETATVTVEGIAWKDGALETTVKVDNRSGHSLPSGVGFRRLFVEFVVLDEAGAALWASGRTNAVGVLLQGIGSTPLPTESGQAGPGGLPFQAHHQVITGDDQVQIYEEVTQDQSLRLTSSFIHRYWMLKDNRLRPWGYDPAKLKDASRRVEYGKATAPGRGPERHWWPEPAPMKYQNPQFPALESYTDTASDPDYDLSGHAGKGLPGTDSLVYRVTLPEATRGRAKSVRVTLYSQSIPPAYLEERFAAAKKPGAERQAADRLYWMVGHLNTDAKAADGQPYLADWRLRVGDPATQAVPAP